MKLFFKYLKSKLGGMLVFLFFSLIFCAAFALYGLPVRAVAYPAGLCALFGLIYLITDFLRTRKKHLFLQRLVGLTAAETEQLPPPVTIDDEDYGRIIGSLKEQTAEILERDSKRLFDTVEYYTLWAHQIKTPIAAMKLALEGEDSPLSRRLNSELFRVEQYVEMVMTYLRLDSETTDYVLAEYDLDRLIKKSVRSFSAEFIDKKLTLRYYPVKKSFVTDEKWFCFVLEQLLSNALKYTKEGGVKIYMKGDSLFVEDSGMGIAPEDLPRIFERGYTGVTGRNERRSSGIGLFLCSRICKNLGIGLGVSSKVSEGTVIELKLIQKKQKSE